MQPYQTDISSIPVIMQGFQPCCVEASLVMMLEYYYWLKTGTYTKLSFRFLAALTAQSDGVNYAASGTSLAVAARIAADTGVCTAATFPNEITLVDGSFIDTTQIPAAAYEEAANFKLPSDFVVMENISWESINAAIEKYRLVLTCLYIDKDWYLSNVPNSNVLPLTPPSSWTDPSISKHATVSYGFDETNRYVRNSFGTTFGNAGNAYYTSVYQPFIYGGLYIPELATLQATQILDTVKEDVSVSPQAESIIQEIEQDIEKVL